MQKLRTKDIRLRLPVESNVKIIKEIKLEKTGETDRGGDLRNKHLLKLHMLFFIVSI
jgi:hypothetical protein